MSSQPPKPTPGPPPTPAALTDHPAVSAPAAPYTGDAISFGRVAEDGTVFVRTPEGEREVGAYPGATPQEALEYYARKYDELAGTAALLLQRVTQTDLSSQEAAASLKALRAQVRDARVVGDLVRLHATLEDIETALRAKQQVEAEQRSEQRAEALGKREAVVAEAERIAAQPERSVQWKRSTARMRELLDEWKHLQRHEVRIDKDTENALWKRFSAARSGFDKMRRSHFAHLDEVHAHAKTTKVELVAEAERLSASTDWSATAGAFKRLMSQWRQAGQASRKDDDALWARFKKAQDAFFAAKDEVVAAENVEFETNLKVKEELLTQAQALLPVRNIEATKSALRTIQDKWDAAGKVPRKDVARMEKGLRKVETAVRTAEDSRWRSKDPEAAARARSMVDQLQTSVASMEADLDRARAAGDERRAATVEKELETKRAWLRQARNGLKEFGG